MTNPEPKEVFQQRFNAVMDVHYKDQAALSLQGWEVPMLYGMVSLALENPDAKQLSGSVALAIRRWLEWCIDTMAGWGLTESEIAWLGTQVEDTKRDAAAHHPAHGKVIVLVNPTFKRLIEQTEKSGNFKSGVGTVLRGECPLGAAEPGECLACRFGHVTECHYPKTCEEARCSHYAHIN